MFGSVDSEQSVPRTAPLATPEQVSIAQKDQTFWDPSGTLLGPFWDLSGTFLESLWNLSGTFMEPL